MIKVIEMKMMEKKHRRPVAIVSAFTALVAIFGWVALATSNADQESVKPQPEFVTADQALAQLEQGNRRCVGRRRDLPHRLGRDHIPR